MEAVKEGGFPPDYAWDNFKLLIMFVSCLFALCAQFYPIPFPDSRPLLGVCCTAYFVLSGVLQFIMTYVDKDMIMLTKAGAGKEALRIRTSFPRFQETFNLTIEAREDPKRAVVAKMYVGRYFTVKGEFDDECYKRDVLTHAKRFESKQYKAFIYDHKSD